MRHRCTLTKVHNANAHTGSGAHRCMAVSSRSSGYQFCTRLCQSGLGGRNGDDSDNESPPPSRDLVGSGEPGLPRNWLCPRSTWNALSLSISPLTHVP